jgi:hypothetical protein
VLLRKRSPLRLDGLAFCEDHLERVCSERDKICFVAFHATKRILSTFFSSSPRWPMQLMDVDNAANVVSKREVSVATVAAQMRSINSS